MADSPQYQDVKLAGLHVPDFSIETDANGHKYSVELPGIYQVGVLFGDHFHVIHAFKAGNAIDAIREHFGGKDGGGAQVQPASAGDGTTDLSEQASPSGDGGQA